MTVTIEKLDPALFPQNKYGRKLDGLSIKSRVRSLNVDECLAVDGSRQQIISATCGNVSKDFNSERKFVTAKMADGRIAVKRIA